MLLTMKPRRIQRSAKPHLQDPKVVGKVHKSASKNQAKPCESYPAQTKPFNGKIFYLDLPSNRRAEALENDIKRLGGTVEKFFSKEIKYLVSNKREARYVQCLGCESPVPSPDSGPSSPHPRPGSYRDCHKGSSQGQADTVVTSRGKSLLERVVKEQERIQVNKILSNALEWGVKILYIDDVLAYIEKKKKAPYAAENSTTTTAAVQKSAKAQLTRKPAFQMGKGGRIGKPFVKVEDSSRHYRPIYLAMSCMPEFNLTSAPPCSPFLVEDKDHPGKRPKEHRNRGGRVSASEERGQARNRRNREKKRGGYCECCSLKYDNIKSHLQSEQHKAFSRSEEYLVVDRLVSTLPFNFRPIKTPSTRRPKCSVSSMLCAAGSSIQMEEVQEKKGVEETKEMELGPVSWSTAVEPPLSQNVGAPVGNPSEQHWRPNSVAPLCNSSQGTLGGSMVPYKPQPLSFKTPCQLESRTHQDPPPYKHLQRAVSTQSDTKPRLCHPGQRTLLDRLGSSSLHHRHESDRCFTLPPGEDLECVRPIKVSLGHSRAAVSSENPKPGALEGCELGCDVSAGDAFPEHGAGDPHTPAPERTLQRRVRDYRRKRRKVDRPQAATTEPGQQSNIPSSGLLSLWQLFHSSEDTDWEFKGFPS
ncbi:protein DBF4 homolog A [Esox lucius]|uniref:Protein DBF4 homolog A n=1 Tax=Esox lucius TaxID=8010 RepID=A0A3P8Y2X0_ESOLU|nr:protein DBF4 homolog A [Esox lucius]